MTFRRIIQIEEEKLAKDQSRQLNPKLVEYKRAPSAPNESYNMFSLTESAKTVDLTTSWPQREQLIARKRKRKRRGGVHDRELELDLQFENIRRVRITTVSRGITKRFEVMFGYFEEGGKPEPAFCCGFRTKDVSGRALTPNVVLLTFSFRMNAV